MKKKWVRRICSTLLAGSMAASLLTGCGSGNGEKSEGSASSSSAQEKQELTIGVTSFADTLEPTEQYFSWVVSRYGIGETLVKFDEKGEIVPCLAESWENSQDKLTWTFKIREGVKFSNGEEMTPELVKASLERTFSLSNRWQSFRAALRIRCFSLWMPMRIRSPLPCPVLSAQDLMRWNPLAPRIPAW